MDFFEGKKAKQEALLLLEKKYGKKFNIERIEYICYSIEVCPDRWKVRVSSRDDPSVQFTMIKREGKWIEIYPYLQAYWEEQAKNEFYDYLKQVWGNQILPVSEVHLRLPMFNLTRYSTILNEQKNGFPYFRGNVDLVEIEVRWGTMVRPEECPILATKLWQLRQRILEEDFPSYTLTIYFEKRSNLLFKKREYYLLNKNLENYQNEEEFLREISRTCSTTIQE